MQVSALVHALLPHLYHCVAQPAAWPIFLDRLTGTLSGRMATVMAADAHRQLRFVEQTGMDQEHQGACALDFLREASDASSRTRKPSAAKATKTEEPATSCLDRYHRADLPLGGVCGFATARLTVWRSAGIVCFGPGDLHLLTSLQPHLREALTLHRETLAHLRQIHVLERLSRSFGLAYIVCDQHGRPEALSARAQALLNGGDGLRVLNGKLTAECASDAPELHRLLNTPHQAPRQTQIRQSITLRRSRGRPLYLTLKSLSLEEDSQAAASSVIFLSDPTAEPPSRAAVLRELYRLMPSEIRLTELLAGGLDVKRAAVRMRTTENSARTLLKSVFRKLDINSQAALVRTVLTLPAE